MDVVFLVIHNSLQVIINKLKEVSGLFFVLTFEDFLKFAGHFLFEVLNVFLDNLIIVVSCFTLILLN